MTNTKTQLAEIREACVKANPSLSHISIFRKVVYSRDIQLGDVLMALSELCQPYSIDAEGNIWTFDYSANNWNATGNYWDLAKPLHLQKPETIAFIHLLLTK